MSDLLNSGFIYFPRYQPKGSKPWKPAPGTCHAGVPDGGRSVDFHQCSRKSVVERDVLHWGKPARHSYCKQHDPVQVKAANEKAEAKYREQKRVRDAMYAEAARKDKLYNAALEAVRQIADGHNDPRGLANDVLAKFGTSAPVDIAL